MIENTPSPNGANGGRDSRGRFARGNPGGPGNPHAKQVGRLRSVLLRTVKSADVAGIVAALVKAAKGGDTGAAKVLFDRLFGLPIATDIVARIEELESTVENRNEH